MPNRPTLDDLRLKMSTSVAAKNAHLFRNGKEKTGHRTAHTSSDMEQNSCYAPLGKEETARFGTQVRVHFHSRRHRLADPDGLSGKYILDGIVRTGLVIADDSAKEIQEVTHSQEKIPKSEAEKTTITIEEV